MGHDEKECAGFYRTWKHEGVENIFRRNIRSSYRTYRPARGKTSLASEEPYQCLDIPGKRKNSEKAFPNH
jgi:hypothetical protein